MQSPQQPNLSNVLLIGVIVGVLWFFVGRAWGIMKEQCDVLPPNILERIHPFWRAHFVSDPRLPDTIASPIAPVYAWPGILEPRLGLSLVLAVLMAPAASKRAPGPGRKSPADKLCSTAHLLKRMACLRKGPSARRPSRREFVDDGQL
jgi:hypothetical protein